MSVNKYFKGKGREVMESMRKRYGDKEGKKIFYATANARNMNPPGKKKRSKKTR